MLSFRTLVAGAFALVQLAFGVAAQSTLPPAPPQKIAVNALTNKVYTANHDADTVTVFNAATGASTPIAVGDGPLYLAVNPVTNRVYVNNARAASISVIDGATDTLIATYPVGSTGPIAVNPVTNVLYIVRLTGTGTDEVTYFNGANNTWYTIAVQSHQPIAVGVNPVTNKIFIATYATGNVSIIDGEFNSNNDHPTPIKMGMWSKPFALAVNPVTNKVFVITEDSRGPVAVLDVNTLTTTFLLAGTARVPKAVAVNPVTNRAYALFSNELVVIDGATLATTSIPVADAGTAVATLGVNTATNRILVASATGVLTVVDGSTNAVITTDAVPAGTSGVAINAATGTSYYFGTVLHAVPRAVGEATVPNPVVTTITPLADDTTGPDATLTLNATTSFAPNALPIRAVYYQLDSTTGPWIAASGTGPYTAAFTGLAPGSHTLHAFAVEGQDAPLATGAHSAPLVGAMASYAFTVASATVDPSVSLASSSNPSTVGSSVTFTASVSGSNGTPTGTVTFRDGTSALCSSVALAAGAATCSTSALSVGTHDITADYSGDASYNPRVSGILQQQVSAAPTAPGAPANVVATPGNNQATIAFTAPSSDGGSPITSYTASCTPGPFAASGSASPLVVTGLANGTQYACSVVATNSVGPGPASAPVNVTPQPATRTLTVAKAGTGTGSVSSLPAGIACGSTCSASFANGASVALTATADGGSTFGGWSGACTGTGACNVTMDAAKSVTATFTVVPPTAPGAPTNVSAAPGNGQATIAFSAPSSDGGSPITSYTVSCTPGPVTASGPASPLVVTGLANGTQYACSVVATNAAGPGPASAPVNVTPQPSVRTLTVAKAGTGTGTVSSLPAGIACGATCSASFAHGANVALTATADGGSTFGGWSGACTGTGACNVTMDAAKSVTATFTAVPPPRVDPTVALSSSSNPSTAGNLVTFTANVSGSRGTATGTVTFRDGTTALCSSVTLASGAASCSGSTLPVGTHDITAQYSGDANYNPRVSAILQQQVLAATTVPGAPTNVAATPGNGQATVAFSPPSSNGGAPITSYTVSCTPGNATASAAASPIVMSGLANGTTYACSVVATNAVGSGPASAPVNVTPQGDDANPPRLGNISTRMRVGTGDDVMIGGFVIAGSTTKRVAVVATGPSLAAFGITNPLADPTLRLVRSSDQATLATNDNWQTAPNQAELVEAGLAPSNALEAAILVDLQPGAYTAIVEGAGGGTGVSVIGVYEVEDPLAPLANISTRGRVLTGDDVMIGGFVINGTGPQTVAIVATGPSLASFGIASPLANPTLTIVRSSDQAVVAANDDWQADANAAQLQAAGLAPSHPQEAALLLTLPPGAYTATVRGAGGGTGVSVIGVYKAN